MVDLTGVTTMDVLMEVKASDPFLYYSIPEVHKRSFTLTDDLDFEDTNHYNHTDTKNDDTDDYDWAQDTFQVQKKAEETAAQEPVHPLLASRTTTDQQQPKRKQRCHRSQISRSHFLSCPAGILANADISHSLFKEGSTVVRRNSRISVEAHDIVVCAEEDFEVMDDYTDLDDSEHEDPLKMMLDMINSVSDDSE